MTRITVAVRTRPTATFASEVIKIQSDNRGIVVELPKEHADEYVNNQTLTFSWVFDAVLHNASQDAVYARIAAPAVADALKGINGTVLMYGQTGSGKTYTTIGDMGTFKYRGIVPRALADVYAYIEARPEMEVSVSISYLEVYNDQLSDLLGAIPAPAGSAARAYSGGGGGGGGDLQICEDGKSGEISVKGLRVLPAHSEQAALALLFEGESNRAVAFHELNKASTRGHAVLTVYLTARSRVESSGRVLSSKLNLVDLAGSERLKKTATSGERMAESMAINRSLSYLEQLVVALGSKNRSHLPYRQSKLTHLLKDAIGGNCKTALVACIYGESTHIEETVSTLNFASRVMRVTNAVTVNAAQDQSMVLRRLEAENKQLRQELAMHDSLASRSRVAYDAYTEAQRAELRERLRAFLNGGAPSIEPESVRMMSEMLEQMKVLWVGLKLELQQRTAADAHPTRTLEAAAAALVEPVGGAGDAGETATVGELDAARSAGIAIGHAPDSAAPAGGFEMPTRRGLTSPTPGSGGFASGDESGGMGGLGGLGGLNGTALSSGAGVADRNEAFALYKAHAGAEANGQLLEAKGAQARLRQMLRAHAERVNGLKAQIAAETAALESKRAERARIEARAASSARTGAAADDGELIIDEEEYALLKALKARKADYRAAHDAHAHTSAELKALTDRADSLRASLLADFNDWFASGGGASLDVFTPPPEKLPRGADVMDDDEAFDMLEQERVREAEPDSLAFFNATKSMKKRGKALRAV
ncbi:hypothetical protein KFE25_002232 [Diacronema lutheri]|uniref:Kinesin-like protein n=1 Tax=Diacronema lutheri TaxID=2081491 RepID=A0A8J6CCU5_DIALT|nr:hypothetical protein KFE25_002232 [Diacronema lutheri]